MRGLRDHLEPERLEQIQRYSLKGLRLDAKTLRDRLAAYGARVPLAPPAGYLNDGEME